MEHLHPKQNLYYDRTREMRLDKAYESNDFESMESILSNYELENGAIEEHDNDADLIVDCDADGYYLLRKISE